MSGSGISWAICKSAPCSRQITTPLTPAPYTTQFFTSQMPFLLPNQQRQSKVLTYVQITEKVFDGADIQINYGCKSHRITIFVNAVILAIVGDYQPIKKKGSTVDLALRLMETFNVMA